MSGSRRFNALLTAASAVLDETRYRDAAEKNLRFLKAKLWDASTGTLHHRWRDGERDTVQLLECYAFLLSGVLAGQCAEPLVEFFAQRRVR